MSPPRIIPAEHLVESVHTALQFISHSHPRDFIRHMAAAWSREESPAAKAAIGQILVNSRMAMLGRRPMCQDTGTVNVFIELGAGARLDSRLPLQELVDDGVRRAYRDTSNPLRASIVRDPLGGRTNTRDNTPAMLHVEIVEGDHLHVHVAAKGGGSENKARFEVLLPGADLAAWVEAQVADMGAGWCPPGVLGLGVGGSPEKAMLLAKQALLAPLDMDQLTTVGPKTDTERLRLEIWDRVNRLGVGAQGLGGLTTVLDVKIKTFPTHAASLPVALVPNCAATRHIAFTLDGTGPASFTPPDPSDWPQVVLDGAADAARKVDLDRLTAEEVATWRAGDRLLLSGRLLTARDAAHRRLTDMLASGAPLPVSLRDRVLYYVGPVDPVGDEVIGPAGPTTASRMDPYLEPLMAQAGVLATIGKAERGGDAVNAIRRHRRAALIAVGGAAYLIAQAVKRQQLVAFADLGMEAIYELDVQEMPVTVAVDAAGGNVHASGPHQWRGRSRRGEPTAEEVEIGPPEV